MKKHIKSIIVSSVAALTFGAIGVGTTFALFTSQGESDVSISSGKINLNLSAGNLTVYSAKHDAQGTIVDENGNHYVYEPKNNNTFTNLGTASLANNVLTLTNITPGDRVTFDAAIGNNSNVAFKYRLVYELQRTESVLASVLETNSNIANPSSEALVKYEGLKRYASAWITPTDPTVASLGNLKFDINLPMTTGNDYQNKTAAFKLSIEAVQANAHTEDAQAVTELLYQEYTPAQETVVENTPTVLTATNSSQSVSVKTTIPADSTKVSANDTVKLEISERDATTETGAETLNFDIDLLVNNTKVSDWDKDIAVEINVGQNRDILKVMHNNVEITNYTYDMSEGIIRFTTKSFSPFSVKFSTIVSVDLGYNFLRSYVIGEGEDAHYVHEINSKDSLRGLPSFLTDNLKNAQPTDAKGIRYADENTVYLVTNDIDFGGETIWGDEATANAVSGITFIGNFAGRNGRSALTNINATLASGKPVLFKELGNATFKNLELDNIRVDGTKKVGLLAVANSASVAFEDESTLRVDNVVVGSNVIMTASDNSLGSLFGDARAYEHVYISNVTTYATLSGVQAVGGIIGSTTTGHKPTGQTNYSTRTMQFDNCYVYANITGKATNASGLGGFIGYAGTSSGEGACNLTMNNCEFGGEIRQIIAGGRVSSIAVWSGADTIGDTIELNNVTCTGVIKTRGELDISNMSGGAGFIDMAVNSTLQNRFPNALVKNGNGETLTHEGFRTTFYQPNTITGTYVDLVITGQENSLPYPTSRANKEVKTLTVAIPEAISEEAHHIRAVALYARHTASYEYDAVGYGASGWGVMYDQVYNITPGSSSISIPRVLYAGHTMAKNKTSWPSSNISEHTAWNYGRFGTSDELINSLGLVDGLNIIDGNAIFLIDNRNIDSGSYSLLPDIASSNQYHVTIYDANNVELGSGRVSDMWLGSRGVLTYSISEYVA